MSKLYTLQEGKFIAEASDTLVAVIDGQLIPNMEQFYVAISKVLNFPDYFGENLDALDEMLYDLDWIENIAILLLVKNSDALLSTQITKREEVIKLIQEIDNPYFEVCFL